MAVIVPTATVTTVEADTELRFAMMVVVPAETEVARPLVLMLATVALVVLHCTVLVRSRVLSSL